MASLNLNIAEKRDVERVLGHIQSSQNHEMNNFLMSFAIGNEASWSRFLRGAYNHPITWWIGVIQLQMQMGIWGNQYKSIAQTRASVLWQVTHPVRDELSGLARGESAPILEAIVKYNFNNRKADILGRFSGGVFTNYASTGGRFGNTRLSPGGTRARSITNFTIASYGAAIKAIAEGKRTYQAVIQSILTGKPEEIQLNISANGSNLSSEESELLSNLATSASDAFSLTHLSPPPIPINEFCSRPENVNLKGLCK
ncbi:hypothetical protein [Nitrincola sp.]|uniref:hypothetical protein n=1 Tax=Nitrincola sp. TaxID=1926584 RepID=UPI003A8DC4B9